MGETWRWETLCGGGRDQEMCYVSGITRHIILLMGGVTVKFADVEPAGFDVGDECAYRDAGH